MISSVQDIVDALTAAYNLNQRLLLLFDYDGTLTPIVSHPRLAGLHPATRRILKNFIHRPRIAVGIISGREIDDLKAMVGLKRIYYAGTAGLELDFCGTRMTHPRANRLRSFLAKIEDPLCKGLKMFPGAWLENKHLGITLHYREVQPDQVPNLKAWVEQVATPLKDNLHFGDGPMAFEITPKSGWNKATAVQLILEHLGNENVLTLYAGDAPNDIAAMQFVTSIGGICIGIGPDTLPVVQYCLADQTVFSAFLANLDEVMPRNTHVDSKRKRYSPALFDNRESYISQKTNIKEK